MSYRTGMTADEWMAERRDDLRGQLQMAEAHKATWQREIDRIKALLGPEDLPFDQRCPSCGMSGPCMWEQCAHPLGGAKAGSKRAGE
ncbi:hypothetical protein KUV62_15795 [Salipiger bermudensis]|uniref:hypothetical protein n=1 Tax=Salipiger bermudensis TaxID=344736 RepID=UPI001C995E64|nr:hypothetical protein [Salipiger bermudensis]MBY6005388.1 hypothetical protein [Salipiger bermudensis]